MSNMKVVRKKIIGDYIIIEYEIYGKLLLTVNNEVVNCPFEYLVDKYTYIVNNSKAVSA